MQGWTLKLKIVGEPSVIGEGTTWNRKSMLEKELEARQIIIDLRWKYEKMENWRSVCVLKVWILVPDSTTDFIISIFIIFFLTCTKGRNLELDDYIPAEEERCNFRAVKENPFYLFYKRPMGHIAYLRNFS